MLELVRSGARLYAGKLWSVPGIRWSVPGIRYHVLFATGYQVDLQRVPLLAAGDLLTRIRTRDGFPVLDTGLQTSVAGLYMTSLPAARDFGLFFAFTAAVRASAQIVGGTLRPIQAG